MTAELIAVIDVGKTNARVALLDASGNELWNARRVNPVIASPLGRQLDIAGIDSWLIDSLRGAPQVSRVRALVPIAHGAAAVLLDADGEIVAAPDYEDPVFAQCDTEYDDERDAFNSTFSPRLPLGLNLARQWFWLEKQHPSVFARVAHLLLLPQYWAWRFSNVMASEVTSLGCHTDLWLPRQGTYSLLAAKHGWSHLLPHLRQAGDSLGTITNFMSQRTGLPADCRIVCGIHDSNASYLEHLIARPRGEPFTVVSSGTWTVVMASGADPGRLRAGRDMLANVDAFGAPVCTARFMGGREYEAIAGLQVCPQPIALDDILQRHVMAIPSFATGGPFADHDGRLLYAGDINQAQRSALATVYCALMTELLLEFLGASGDIIIDGPFAANPLYGPLLAALRPLNNVIAAAGNLNCSRAASYLAGLTIPASIPKLPFQPLQISGLTRYRAAWRELLPPDHMSHS